MMPLPTVDATAVEISAPTMFMTAAIASATRGVSASRRHRGGDRVAESWKPLVKSKPSATMTITMTSAVEVTPYDSLTAIVSTAWATCSSASAASSNPSATSRSLTMVSAS